MIIVLLSNIKKSEYSIDEIMFCKDRENILSTRYNHYYQSIQWIDIYVNYKYSKSNHYTKIKILQIQAT